jgi:hypothetical protein
MRGVTAAFRVDCMTMIDHSVVKNSLCRVVEGWAK